MKWSQLKLRIESLFADSVRGRVELRTTRYHKAHDQMGRGWITLDKKQIINMCDFAFEMKVWEESKRLQKERDCANPWQPDQFAQYHNAVADAETILHSQSNFSRWEFTTSLRSYLTLSADGILKSPNPIIRAIGMLDRRIGKGRLAKLRPDKEPLIVRQLFEFRCTAEGLKTGTQI